jgi:diguanylate cyclase (GGDEF)-like protein
MNAAAATILIVDDELNNREQLEHFLKPDGYRTIGAASGSQALASISDEAPDLILLDVTMPGMDGYEVATVLKNDPATSSIPIIMVTGQAGRGARMVGLDTGVEEYLTKPVDPAELSLRVRNLLRLKTHGDPATNDGAAFEHQPQLQMPVDETQHRVRYDVVTGLPTGTLFLESLQLTLQLASETGSTVAVMSIDLDDFREVNDKLGIAGGDELLRQFGALLQCAGGRDAVGRVYEDKFALAMATNDDEASPTAVANAIRDAMRTPFEFNGNEVLTTASIGIAVYPVDATDPIELMGRSDAARRQAKRAGGNSFLFYAG